MLLNCTVPKIDLSGFHDVWVACLVFSFANKIAQCESCCGPTQCDLEEDEDDDSDVVVDDID